ncbi:hypothetical protein NHP190012_11310 [Helicobacter sp. NHP19-012]|uniref:Addiction module antidote protein n=1 Tax=Helicobacter gastrofelis TaxID=2849642 RepID=A0ABN6I9Y3_9HELI|nr:MULTISPECIES: hypothetical protein [unclassified Helicobacter]BCZ19489.1 hypothetical protein NHP190012_11310 [Helicobacter sp. NHP19-012]GMB96862.1 hypothetical protein NHP22001_14510 [Helicobacter sp. NHP22-001]
MEVTFSPFSVVEFLNSDEKRLSYLNAVLEDGDLVELQDALEVIAKSKGVELPKGDSLLELVKYLGFNLQAQAKH